jgi:hypothetical protein
MAGQEAYLVANVGNEEGVHGSWLKVDFVERTAVYAGYDARMVWAKQSSLTLDTADARTFAAVYCYAVAALESGGGSHGWEVWRH